MALFKLRCSVHDTLYPDGEWCPDCEEWLQQEDDAVHTSELRLFQGMWPTPEEEYAMDKQWEYQQELIADDQARWLDCE